MSVVITSLLVGLIGLILTYISSSSLLKVIGFSFLPGYSGVSGLDLFINFPLLILGVSQLYAAYKLLSFDKKAYVIAVVALGIEMLLILINYAVADGLRKLIILDILPLIPVGIFLLYIKRYF